ncbi:MAG TPA: MBL fold metallo-hydrolase [Xanthobacteraceae bacterium]|jgi:glyoxylase-like metal-dependent hydrolase (beta-lactamase superfamily II)|nr:MBL fold metallo-hydrolase [Xanthobacteraceae bacterium]
MQIDGYAVDILVQGYPGKTVCHGGLGWSTIVLIRGQGHVALVDTGGFGVRKLIMERLAHHGLKPADVTDLLLTHVHHDHCVNWTLFSRARIVVGASELAWAVDEPWGETSVPELYVRELAAWPTVHKAADSEEVLTGITVHSAPGHTPGHLIYVLSGRDREVIFTGDAAKNRAELVSRMADASYDAMMSKASIEKVWSFWQRRPGSVVVPGHDIPMVQRDGKTEYLSGREAAIKAWFGDDLETMTTIALTVA